MPTLVCVPILVEDAPGALARAHTAQRAGANIVELRIDRAFTGAPGAADRETREIVGLVASCPLPCIVTCRAASEGGFYDGADEARVALLARLVGGAMPPTMVDVEWAHWAGERHTWAPLRRALAAAAQPPTLILSVHDFSGPPAGLMRSLASMSRDERCGIIKVAFRARTLHDALSVLELPAALPRPAIALGMGDPGVISRVLAPKFGAFLTFASVAHGAGTAPGQPTLQDLFETYRFRSIGASTDVYGVVGSPVTHSLSPVVHNAAFAALGVDAVYVPMPVEAYEGDGAASDAAFKAQLLEAVHHERLGLRGASVTMPHKERLARLARAQGWDLDTAARETSAGNTLVIERRAGAVSRVRVLNTDAPAVERLLTDALGALAGKRVGVVGTGGVGRAAAYAAARRGATVVVHGRDAGRARTLCDLLAPHCPDGELIPAELASLDRVCCDAVVQATPIGMEGAGVAPGAALPVGAMNGCPDRCVLLETVYKPIETPTVKAARARGWRVIDGVTLFVTQAEMQCEHWTGSPPPRGLFDRLARAAAEARR